MADPKPKTPEIPPTLIPINGLATSYRKQVLKQAEILNLKKGKNIFKQGDTDDFSFYLLEGEIALYNSGRLTKQVIGGSPEANNALAQLRPRQFTAKAKTDVTVLRLDRALLDKFLALDSSEHRAEITVAELDADEASTDWMTRMLQSELFSRIPTANIQRLFVTLEPIEVNAGDVVIKQGAPGDYYFIIQEGTAEVVRQVSHEGKEVKLAELRPGDSFGEEALVSDAKRNATVRMLTPGQLMRMTKDDFVELIKKPILRSVRYEEGLQLVKAGAKWLDVRFADEHTEAAIEDSINVPLTAIRSRSEKLNSDQTYVVYCDTGSRSSVGAFLLSERGFDVAYLEGGFSQVKGVEAAERVTPSKAPAIEQQPSPVPARAAEQAAPSFDAEVRASALKAELARANLQLKEAIELKTEADEARQEAEKETETRFDEERKRLTDQAKEEMDEARQLKTQLAEAKSEIEAQLLAKKQALEMKATQASDVLRQALNLKRQIESAQQNAEQEAQQRREEEERQLAELKRQAERRLKEEKAKLEGMYAHIAEELERIQNMRAEAEAKLQQDRTQLEQDSVASKQRLAEAKRIEALVKQESQRLLVDQDKAETELRKQMKQRIDAERRRLEMEFARNAEELEQTKRQKAAAEAARRAAAEEAERVISEFRNHYTKIREKERQELQAQRKKLLKDAQKIQAALERAKQMKTDAKRHQHTAQKEVERLRTLQQSQPSDQQLSARLQSLEAEAAQAGQQIQEAERAQREAQAAFSEHQKGMVMADNSANNLQKRIEEEVKEWMAEQETWETSTMKQIEKAKQLQTMERIKLRAEQARADIRRHNQSLIDDVEAQLDKP
jgi:CRP-like cAMP-binding protein/rhodanese-related sulfurtransferase